MLYMSIPAPTALSMDDLRFIKESTVDFDFFEVAHASKGMRWSTNSIPAIFNIHLTCKKGYRSRKWQSFMTKKFVICNSLPALQALGCQNRPNEFLLASFLSRLKKAKDSTKMYVMAQLGFIYVMIWRTLVWIWSVK